MINTAQEEYVELLNLLKELAIQGGFTLAVLTDQNGLPIASSDSDQEISETQAAVVAQIQSVILRAVRHLSMSSPDEVVLSDADGRKLVCREFAAGDRTVFYLAILIPNRKLAYRKLMNRAIRSMQATWKI